jgi:hypothetical protein
MRECKLCGKWYRFAYGSTKWCSNACRQKAYRERRRTGGYQQTRYSSAG